MNYLYHMVPDNMKGNVLFPLNELRKKYPEVYKEKIKKYIGRKSVLRIRIPYLNCLWNDVLHFTAIHSLKFREAIRKTKMKTREKIRWFKIDSCSLDSPKTIVYLYKNWKYYGNNFTEDNFVKYDPDKLSKYNKLPRKTITYYKKEIKNNRTPLLFHHVPHILHKGTISVKNVEIIEV